MFPSARGDATWEAALPLQRARLVQYCRLHTGDLDAAEDLAQETLYEAWRCLHKLHDPEGFERWLGAIARNVCRRWVRERRRDFAHRSAPDADEERPGATWEETLPDTVDLELDLERAELLALLERALALLPPDTRQVLIQRYVEESPQAEIASRLGVSEGAVEARLQRGKLTLQRLLTTTFGADAVPYGLLDAAAGWQATRIWCPGCGTYRLLGRFANEHRQLSLRCPGCSAPGATDLCLCHGPLLARIKGFKPALSRVTAWAGGYFRSALRTGATRCPQCGATVPLRTGLCDLVPLPRQQAGGLHVLARCPACAWNFDYALKGLVLALPAGRRFWRDHPRMRVLPERAVEAAGLAAVVTSYESVTDRSRLDVVSARQNFAVLGIFGAPATAQEEQEADVGSHPAIAEQER